MHGHNIGNWDKTTVARAAPEASALPSWILQFALEIVIIFYGTYPGETQYKTNEGQNESVACAPQFLDSVDCVHVCNEWSSFTRKTVSMFVALFYG